MNLKRRVLRLAFMVSCTAALVVLSNPTPATASWNCWGCALDCNYGAAVHACGFYCWGWSPTGQCAYVPDFCPAGQRAVECQNPEL